MKILALDTSSISCSVALSINGRVHSRNHVAPKQQAQMILPMIDELLQAENIKLNQLDALAFGCGPGSFTGVRIATSVMQGLGYALKLPLIPVSSLAGLAQAAYTDLGWQQLLVAVDARIQEIYWGIYQVNPQGLVELVGKEAVCPPTHPPIDIDVTHYKGVGDGWKAYEKEIPIKPLAIDATRLPTAVGIIPLAELKFAQQDWLKPQDALPSYLRDNVASK